MARRGRSLAAISLFLVALLAALWGGAFASAAPKDDKKAHRSRDATISKKAWFTPAAPCTSLDCSVLPPVNPHPENTLHVGVSGGQETARTYLALEFKLPSDTEPIGGTLELPLDTDATHGSVTPEEADVVACVAAGKFEAQRGAVSSPPEVDCEVRRSAVYSEKRASSLTVDLGRFAEAWDEDVETTAESQEAWKVSIAIVASPNAQAGNETWRAVFPATDPPRKKAERDETPTISATIEYGPATDESTFPPDLFGPGSGLPPGGSSGSDIPSGSDFDSGSGSGFDSGSGGAPPPASNDSGVGSFGSAAGAPEDAAATDSAPTGQVAAPPGSLVGFAGPGFAYPIMWALPLAILVALAATGRALTKELYRRGL